SKDSITDATRR
ncbi:unnamed protein product, partial [Oikopleura dioica]